MLQNFKIYLIEIGLKKIVPMAVIGGITALCSLLAAHKGMLSPLGIDFDPTDRTIDISLDTLQNWMIVALGGGITALMAVIKHHTVSAATGEPQNGDMRKTAPLIMEGGARKEDKELLK